MNDMNTAGMKNVLGTPTSVAYSCTFPLESKCLTPVNLPFVATKHEDLVRDNNGVSHTFGYVWKGRPDESVHLGLFTGVHKSFALFKLHVSTHLFPDYRQD